MESETRIKWWGEFTLGPGEAGYWHVGPLELLIKGYPGEWRVFSRSGDDPLAPHLLIETPSSRVDLGDGAQLHRFGYRSPGKTLRIMPSLPRRPLIVRPDIPLSLPPREEATVYISSPLWVDIHLGEQAERALSIPVNRPSDTWFGPSTMVGELCYASRTNARLNLADLEVRPHRAVSPVRVRNRAATLLNLDKLKLPVANLSLFEDGRGQLWTEDVTLDREEDGDFAALRLGKGPAKEAGDAPRVQKPQEAPQKGLAIRSFGGIFT